MDVDEDPLALSASLADGDPLPGWLTFDASTGTFSGVPKNSDVGAFSVRLVATDISGLTAFQDISFTVENTNDAPEIWAIGDQATAVEEPKIIKVAYEDPDAFDGHDVKLELLSGEADGDGAAAAALSFTIGNEANASALVDQNVTVEVTSSQSGQFTFNAMPAAGFEENSPSPSRCWMMAHLL